MTEIIRSTYMNFYEFMCSYNAENDEKLKQRFLSIRIKFCIKIVSRNGHIDVFIRKSNSRHN
jgi:hypothetical protein